ncbi:carboxylate-amine ligase [Mesonia maritima]|uniref:Carboxylate-amine ligase n=1 Tax=Mesonia maritima TaxID=1793873 RepID=A0ABU1K6A0_9FLAO|nr:glutamate-cysteine ligase family protein [Mesonia maritima]MDR6301139.1 carboxylate-amine ligase [Mesonia maritima]
MKSKKYHLFEVVGIELEYMLVNAENLSVIPAVDEILTEKNGSLTSDIDNGEISWSNELVAHVIELKTNGPTDDHEKLSRAFYENIKEINKLLKPKGRQLLSTASHPLMNPKTETKLWKHTYSEVYALYNKIFDCSGHGWSNVQSMHLNFPFYNDEEFEKLHAAIRILLPIIPALTASSPIFEGKVTGFKDSRLEVYKNNQKEILQLTGKVIPERVFSKKAYQEEIFEPIQKAIKPYDAEGILDRHFLNSRGAIARFDRNAIEIRIIDIQECPKVDIAIADFIIKILQHLVYFGNLELQKSWSESDLFEVFNEVIKKGEETTLQGDYLKIFDLPSDEISITEVWKHLFRQVSNQMRLENQEIILFILEQGCLSTRIISALEDDFSTENIQKIYHELASCLAKNKLFIP